MTEVHNFHRQLISLNCWRVSTTGKFLVCNLHLHHCELIPFLLVICTINMDSSLFKFLCSFHMYIYAYVYVYIHIYKLPGRKHVFFFYIYIFTHIICVYMWEDCCVAFSQSFLFWSMGTVILKVYLHRPYFLDMLSFFPELSPSVLYLFFDALYPKL